MGEQPLISIVVPIYNAERYLERCLDSLKRQTYRSLEILLIDDGSTDATEEICRRYERADSRFRYIFQTNSGVSAARNHGIDLARGDYLGFCDSDDWAEPDLYECLYQLLIQTQSDIAIVSAIQDYGNAAAPVEDDPTVQILDAEHAVLEMHRGKLYEGQLWNKLIRAELFDGVRLCENIAICEDMLLMWELFRRAEKVAFCNVRKYHYYQNPDSSLRTSFRDSYRTVQRACELMIKNMETYYPQHMRYAQKTSVVQIHTLAVKMALADRLTLADYREFRDIVKHHYTAEVKALIDRKFRVHLSIFMTGRAFFVGYLKSRAFYRKLKQKNK